MFFLLKPGPNCAKRFHITLLAGQPWMDCRPVHQIRVYMGDDQNHFNNNQTRGNTIIGTLTHYVVQDNGTDSQENPVNNSYLNKRIW